MEGMQAQHAAALAEMTAGLEPVLRTLGPSKRTVKLEAFLVFAHSLTQIMDEHGYRCDAIKPPSARKQLGFPWVFHFTRKTGRRG